MGVITPCYQWVKENAMGIFCYRRSLAVKLQGKDNQEIFVCLREGIRGVCEVIFQG